MKVAILQPNYIPWKGYSHLIHDVDTETSYIDSYGGDSQNLNNPKTTVNFFKNLIDCVHNESINKNILPDSLIDTGSILFQRNVLNPFLNDAQLRKALSFLSRTLVGDIISHYPNYQEIAVKDTESYFSARAEADSIAKLSDFSTIDELVFHIKAFTNYPMPKLDISGRVFVIDYENPEISINIELANNSFDLLGYWQASD
jgi:hypothetical protein